MRGLKGVLVNRNLSIMAVASVLLAGGLVQAQVQREKDWQVERLISSQLQVDSCVSSSQNSSSKLTVKLEIDSPVTDNATPLILIKARGLGGKYNKAFLKLDSKNLLLAPLLSRDAQTGEEVFVLLPTHIPQAIQFIAEKRNLDIQFGEGRGVTNSKISLSGSVVTLNRQAVCRGSQQIYNVELINELRRDLASAPARAGSIQELLVQYKALLDQLKVKNAKAQELAQHQAQGRSIESQERAALALLTERAGAETSTIQDITNLNRRLAQLEQSLADSRSQLPGLESQLPARQQAVTRAEQAIAPFEPRVRDLSSEVTRAENARNVALQQVNAASSRLQSAESHLAQLHRHLVSLESDRSNKQYELRRVEDLIRDLEQRHRMWNEREELRRYLDNDYSYRNEVDRLRKWEDINRRLPREVEVARARVQEADRAFKDCSLRNKPGAPGCEKEADALNRSQSQLQTKINELSESERKLVEIRRDLDRREANAVHEVRRQREQLVYDRNEAQRSRDRISRDVRDLDSSIQQVRFSSIPTAEREVSSARIDLSSAQSNLASATSRVDSAERNLADYKASVGYDRLSQELRQARSSLSQLQSSIAQAKKIIQENPGLISSTRQQIQSKEQLLVQQRAARQQAEANLQLIRESLSAHRDVEAVIAAELRSEESNLVQVRRVAQGLTKQTF